MSHQVKITVETVGMTFGWHCAGCGAEDRGFDNKQSAINAAECYHRQVSAGNGSWDEYRALVTS